MWLHFAFSRQSFRIRMDIKQSAYLEPLRENPSAARRQNPCARGHLPRVCQMPQDQQLLAAAGKYAAHPAARPGLASPAPPPPGPAAQRSAGEGRAPTKKDFLPLLTLT